MTLSEIAAASDSIVTPVSEKKLRWVKTGSLTKSWTHSRPPRTTSSLIATRSKLTINFSPDVTGPRMASAVNWKTWYKRWMSYKLQQDGNPQFWKQYKLYTDEAAHGSQPVQSRTSGRSLHQGGSWLKSAPAASALARTTGTPTCRLTSLRPSHILSLAVHQATCQRVA